MSYGDVWQGYVELGKVMHPLVLEKLDLEKIKELKEILEDMFEQLRIAYDDNLIR